MKGKNVYQDDHVMHLVKRQAVLTIAHAFLNPFLLTRNTVPRMPCFWSANGNPGFQIETARFNGLVFTGNLQETMGFTIKFDGVSG